MISTGELKKGVVIELEGDLWQILDYHHIKMGRGSAQVRIKLYNIKRGSTVERTFQAGEKWPRAYLEKRPIQFLYQDGSDYHFMETETYDQFHMTADELDEAVDDAPVEGALERRHLADDPSGAVHEAVDHHPVEAQISAGAPICQVAEGHMLMQHRGVRAPFLGQHVERDSNLHGVSP